MNKFFKNFWLVVLSVSTFAALGQSQTIADEKFEKATIIKIGMLAPLHLETGMVSANAAKLAVEEINSKGGILGKKVELVVRDDQFNPTVSVDALKKLVYEDRCTIICGGWSSGAALAMQEHLKELNVVYLGAGGPGSPMLVENVRKNYDKYKYYFMLMHNTERHNPVTLEYVREILVNELKMKKIAFLSEAATWTKPFEPFMKRELPKLGIEIVASEYVGLKTPDFVPIFTKIAATGAEYILVNAAITPGQFITKGWVEAKAPPIGCHSTDAQPADYWEKTGGLCNTEVTFWCMGGNIPITPKTQPFHDRYLKKFGRSPTFSGYNVYDGIYIIADVFQRIKSLETEAIIRGFEETAYLGTTGLIEWQKEDHDIKIGPGRPTNYFVQWQNGKQVVLYPKRLRTGNFMYPPWIKK